MAVLWLILAVTGLCAAQPRAVQHTVPPAKLEAIYPQGLRVSIPVSTDDTRNYTGANPKTKLGNLAYDPRRPQKRPPARGAGVGARCVVDPENLNLPAAVHFLRRYKCINSCSEDDGYSLFAFHGNLNEEMNGLEAGHWARDITKAKGGRWTFRDKNAKLKLGDKIYFWTYVIKDGLGYRQDDGEWTVTEFVNEDGTPVDSSMVPAPPATPVPQTPQPGPAPIPQPTPAPAPVCQASLTAVQGLASVCKGALIFNEEFDAGDINSLNRWDPLIEFPEEPDHPFNVYMKEDDTLGLQGGELVLSPVLLETRFREGYVDEALDLSDR
ncbi:Beta-1,3-glucan-binding protein [Eumeta japonica]|uniref:Beta-1,3-glucan-binding protein n=1 Tax=Eumeta variegata TaxID=151549 RepID=A0A4C1WFL9_EUMVA|nr:Beta-1,3-glucan-binding protein [Eumeta japonica]